MISFFVICIILCLAQCVQSFTLGYHPPLIIKGSKLKMAFDWTPNKKNAEERMTRAVDSMVSRLATIRASGANPDMLNRVKVEVRSQSVTLPLPKVAKIQTAGPNALVVEPFDKEVIDDICVAISKFDSSLFTTPEGNKIRVAVPPISEERRKELVAQAKIIGEEGKKSLRGTRHDILDLVRNAEKGKLISKDASHGYQNDLTKLTTSYVNQVEEMIVLKSKDLMRI